ncbi:elongation of very long chain fatty acids protein AAEL008004-like [Ixodes scapularis]|uniref:elongation of very long chain fatty acids protein AAEL008004-like n=1 Tax=Ixodes scapularis TaxID=6945 RepID=UPI001A9CE4C8|nr:elongation of very long chain fatty acids protein AAEL008004-like [Ixodes scapularis]
MASANFGWDLSDILPRRDPRTKGWVLVGNKAFLVAVITGYVYLVKIAGPGFMKTRKPYNGLKPYMLLYNLAMVIAYVYFVTNFLFRSYLGGGYNIVCQGIDFEARDLVTMEYLELCWWYVWVRVADLLDTVFFILRKKNSNVSFFHVSHHAIVVFNCWYGLAYGADGQPALGICINSFTHVIMYSYYFLSLLGPTLHPYLWWKRHLTQLQLVQFGIIITHNLIPLFIDCGYPRSHAAIFIAELIVITTSFFRFYVSAYGTKSDLKGKVQ